MLYLTLARTPFSSWYTLFVSLVRTGRIRSNVPPLSQLPSVRYFTPACSTLFTSSRSLFLSLHSSHSSPPVPLSLSLAPFFLIYRPRQLYTRRPLPFISRNNSILVYVSPLLARCLARMYPPSRATSYLTPSLAFGARASIQRRVPRLPLLYTCH